MNRLTAAQFVLSVLATLVASTVLLSAATSMVA